MFFSESATLPLDAVVQQRSLNRILDLRQRSLDLQHKSLNRSLELPQKSLDLQQKSFNRTLDLRQKSLDLQQKFLNLRQESLDLQQKSYTRTTSLDPLKRPHSGNSLFGGCTHVYLDTGSNLGVQVRKLFEPLCYPLATVAARILGDSRSEERTVCAVGFEPNIQHTPRLRRVERHLQKRGFRASFLTETGVGGRDGFQNMTTDNDSNNHFWGFGTAKRANAKVFRVQMLNAGKWIFNRIVHLRPLPKVCVKLDVESSEYETLASMLAWGSFRFIDEIWVEWHDDIWARESWEKTVGQMRPSLEAALEIASFAGVMAKFVPMDDEPYREDTPSCPMDM